MIFFVYIDIYNYKMEPAESITMTRNHTYSHRRQTRFSTGADGLFTTCIQTLAIANCFALFGNLVSGIGK